MQFPFSCLGFLSDFVPSTHTHTHARTHTGTGVGRGGEQCRSPPRSPCNQPLYQTFLAPCLCSLSSAPRSPFLETCLWYIACGRKRGGQSRSRVTRSIEISRHYASIEIWRHSLLMHASIVVHRLLHHSATSSACNMHACVYSKYLPVVCASSSLEK